MKSKGLLIVISGPSGVGKKTVWSPIINHANLKLGWSISMTTRPMRPGEVNGKDYFFVSKDEFKKAIADGQLLEWAEYANNYYGTPRKYIEHLRENGKNAFLEIECQGALNLINMYKDDPKLLTIFIAPPSLSELSKRLKNRNTESDDIIAQRIKQAEWELEMSKHFQHIIVNDDLAKAQSDLLNLLESKVGYAK